MINKKRVAETLREAHGSYNKTPLIRGMLRGDERIPESYYIEFCERMGVDYDESEIERYEIGDLVWVNYWCGDSVYRIGGRVLKPGYTYENGYLLKVEKDPDGLLEYHQDYERVFVRFDMALSSYSFL